MWHGIDACGTGMCLGVGFGKISFFRYMDNAEKFPIFWIWVRNMLCLNKKFDNSRKSSLSKTPLYEDIQMRSNNFCSSSFASNLILLFLIFLSLILILLYRWRIRHGCHTPTCMSRCQVFDTNTYPFRRVHVT